MKDLAKRIEHTVLKPDAPEKDIIKVCEEAKKYGFAAVVVNPYYVPLVKEQLKESGIKVATVVGFPLGASTTKTKAFETQDAVMNGAEEIDMVLNIAALKDKQYDIVEEDIRAVVQASYGKAIVKVILETCLLTKEEKIKACELAKKAGAHFVKTSTGFGTGGATVEDVKLLRETVGESMGVKAAGGIRTYETAVAMVKAGADRIGCSASVAIIREALNSPIE